MKFCSENQIKKETIKNVEREKDECKINYFDGSSIIYENINDDFLNKLEIRMINEALIRDKEEYKITLMKQIGDLCLFIGSSMLMFKSVDKSVFFIFILSSLLLIFSYCGYLNNVKKLNELKKYRILINDYKKIKENKDITKVLEFDNFYREELDIFTLDNYSYLDMKIINKELKKR